MAEAEALADPTRYRLYQLLLDSEQPRSVAELTDAVGVHHTAVRSHLARLVTAGLVTEERSAPNGRGRPPVLYAATPRPDTTGDGDAPYQRLAALLTRALADGTNARDAGRDAGRREAATARDAAPDAGPLNALLGHAERNGFAPELDETNSEIVLGHCPYADVAAVDPATICALHLGLAEGITEELGGNVSIGLAAKDPHYAGCRLRVTHQPPDPPAP